MEDIDQIQNYTYAVTLFASLVIFIVLVRKWFRRDESSVNLLLFFLFFLIFGSFFIASFFKLVRMAHDNHIIN